MSTANITIVKYHGVMDCYGVESFQQEVDTTENSGSDPRFLKIRAMANAQRHALFYEVDLDSKDKEYVDGLLARSDWEGACVFIKSQDSFKNHGPGKDKLIPNKELDPWG